MRSSLPIIARIAGTAAFVAALTFIPSKVHRVALGTHAPKIATEVWKVLEKSGGSASAVPVRELDDKVIFLTSGHLCEWLEKSEISVVENIDQTRKLKILKWFEHPEADLAVLHVQKDPQTPIKIIPIGIDVVLEPGLSVFAVGYPGPTSTWYVSRGYLSANLRFFSGNVYFGMSGGALLTPEREGQLVGILEGFCHETIGPFARRYLHGQGAFTVLAPHKDWLRGHGALGQ
jgi:hypothetical protein